MNTNAKLHDVFEEKLARRGKKSARRKLTVTDGTSIDFSSNDFLSLSHSPVLRSEFFTQLQQAKYVPLGSGGSRLLDGNSEYIEKLEQNIADFHRAPSGLLFNSGFDANSALFSCVPQFGDIVIYDEFVHASVHEGMRLSRAKECRSFAHNSVTNLSLMIDSLVHKRPELASGESNLFVAIETVYSMDGDVAPVKDIVDLLSLKFPNGNGHIIVDEAHSTGVFGDRGRGIVCELGLEDRILARLHTFGKALSSGGAIVFCSSIMREYLINYARSLIYTTALGLPTLAMITSAYRLLRRGATLKAQHSLWRLVNHFYNELRLLPNDGNFHVHPDPPQSPIFSLRTAYPRELASACQRDGFVVRPIVHPTVSKGAERVRVCLHAGNTEEQVDRLVATIRSWLVKTNEGQHGGVYSKSRL